MSLGAAVTFAVTDLLGIQLGGAYAQKGASTTVQGLSVTAAIDYVEIPVLLRIGIPSESPLSAHFSVGPAVSFEATCDGELSGPGGSITIDCNEFDFDTKSIDFGAVGGLGIDVEVSSAVVLTLDVLYNLGLSSIDDSGGDTKNRALSILVGAGFPVG